ncbi:hypothetical protein I8752_36540 [Nostocaceae cyanobacterium CENA369]|uniref:Uncharacterized protein n=1 Tax=Dendronalium phyllosphericum CENA369 TaxID=1725256 RepID=A0A8J7I8Y4_9NOST|nr:hypothetical protein [Dendronalium phyllosphericum]MBH8578355.1 hypothetical protein [Dendronalium phyllosphericum CENA369]
MISETPSRQTVAVLNAAYKDSDTRNRFDSFEDFQSFVRNSFIQGSGIDSDLFDACIEFHQDLEFFDGYDCNTPIHDALNWEYKRFTKQANEPLYAAFLTNEDDTATISVTIPSPKRIFLLT